MATVELTPDQILQAVQRLPEPQRRALLAELAGRPSPEAARRAARGLRGAHQLSKQQRRRLTDLLAKGNAGTLSAAQSTELDQLVAEFERKTLALARTLAEKATAGNGPST